MSVLTVLVVLLGTTRAHASSLKVVADLIERFDEKLVANTLNAADRGNTSSGRTTHRGLYLHPVHAGDATITYEIELPGADAQGGELALVAWTCVHDTVLEKDKHKRCNGTRFIIRLDGKEVFTRDQKPGEWLPVFIPLDAYAGKTVKLQLATNAIDGNTNYDWAYWGDPRVMLVTRTADVEGLAAPAFAGLVLAPAEEVGKAGVPLNIQAVDADGNVASDAAEVWLAPAPGSAMSVAQYDLSKGLTVKASMIRVAAAKGETPNGMFLAGHGTALSVAEPWAGRAVLTEGEELPVCVLLSNGGLAPWVPRGHEVIIRMQECGTDEPVKSRDRWRTASFKVDRVIPAGEQATFWGRFPVESHGRVMIEGHLRAPPRQLPIGGGRSVAVFKAVPILQAPVARKVDVEIGDGQVVIQNPACRVVFAKRTTGRRRSFPPTWTVHLQLPQKGQWRSVAVCPHIADVCLGETDREQQEEVASGYRVNDLAVRQSAAPFRKARCTIESVTPVAEKSKDGPRVAFEIRMKEWEASQAAPLQIRLVYALHKTKPIIDVTGELSAKQELHLRRFCPISLRTADGLPTKDRGMALLPGLEYLNDGEPSSSTRDAAPPINNRLMPDPLKITVPMMMVSTQVGMVTLMWNPNQKWDGVQYGPCAAFASPNFVNRQENHLMEVFAPSFPNYVNENERLAAQSYEMKPGQKVTVSARVVLRPKGDAVDAMKDYFALNPPPKPAPKQYDLQTLYDISRHGFLETVWYEDKQKSSHCVGWAPANAPQFGVLLLIDSILAKDAAAGKAARERAELIWRNTLRDGGPNALCSPACCHIMREDAPFYTGHIAAAVKHLLASAKGQIRNANADGVWGFQPPKDARHESLGPRGYASQGIVARGALELMRIARVTGDADALAAALKALEYHKRFRVPHGAQGWECPIYEPDVLGAAYAVGAYVDAYEITGKREYLDQAIDWAWTGMAFQYVWQAPDREQWMRYASIPVFGTTFFTHSWLGNPVQWCGLVYAYYLQRLAPHDTSFPWKRIAEGMTVSGEWLQFGNERPELKGVYPDGLYKRLTDRCPAMINPEDIIVNRYFVEGHDPRVKTVYARPAGQPRIHISSCATPGAPKLDGKTLRVPLAFYAGEFSGTLLANCEKPTSVSLGGRKLPEVASLPEAPQGWQYLEKSGHLIVRAKHPSNDPVTLGIEFP